MPVSISSQSTRQYLQRPPIGQKPVNYYRKSALTLLTLGPSIGENPNRLSWGDPTDQIRTQPTVLPFRCAFSRGSQMGT